MKKRDVYLLLAILAVAALYFTAQLFIEQEEGKTVLIKVNQKIVNHYALDEDHQVLIETERGNNHIVIKNGEVFVDHADCPDQICVRHHPIHFVNETIICLPHKVVIEVTGQDEGVDLIAE